MSEDETTKEVFHAGFYAGLKEANRKAYPDVGMFFEKSWEEYFKEYCKDRNLHE